MCRFASVDKLYVVCDLLTSAVPRYRLAYQKQSIIEQQQFVDGCFWLHLPTLLFRTV